VSRTALGLAQPATQSISGALTLVARAWSWPVTSI